MIRKGIRPSLRVATGMRRTPNGFRKVMPFRRSWVAIVVLAAFDIAFLVPAITTFQHAAAEWSRFDDLFDLVTAVFLSAWLIGWSIGPLIMTSVLALMLFGREVLMARPGEVELFIGLPFLGLSGRYRAVGLRNLRLEEPPPRSGRSWRGPHLACDYGANELRFGSDLGEADLAEVSRGIEVASGHAVRQREATPAELAGQWETDPALEALAAGPGDPPPTVAPGLDVALTSPSTLALVAANLVPLFGAAFWGWELSDVMVLYWAESGVIGLYNVAKMAVISRWLAVPAGVFFLAHYGAFMAVHFLFIWSIFVEGVHSSSGGDLQAVGALFQRLWPALAALFLSHGASFFLNFLGRGEYARREVRDQMSEPYSRIVFMHLVLIFGGGLVLVMGESTPVLLVVIAIKIWVDILAHLKQRAQVVM